VKGLTLVVIVPITLPRRIPKFCSRTRERFVIDAAETKPSACSSRRRPARRACRQDRTGVWRSISIFTI